MTELKITSINTDISEDSDNSEDDQPFLENPSHNPSPHEFCCPIKCQLLILIISTIAFGLLWLSESQFSQGVLRLRHINETCGFSIFGNNVCAKPLKCNNNLCIYDDIPPILNCNQSNIDMFCPKQTPCPRCPRCPPCQNLVSYFDYVEFINYYIEPTVKERTKIIVDIPYGGCKELCSRRSDCKAICFRGDSNVCHLRNTYTLPP